MALLDLRTLTNETGTTYDAGDTDRFFAEDWTDLIESLESGTSGIKTESYVTAAEIASSATTATTALDFTSGNFQTVEMQSNTTLTFTAPNGVTDLKLRIVQAGIGSYTITWPATVKWPSGSAPTLSTGVGDIDLISLYYDGTNYYGTSSLDFQ